jgi:hypothetical protein
MVLQLGVTPRSPTRLSLSIRHADTYQYLRRYVMGFEICHRVKIKILARPRSDIYGPLHDNGRYVFKTMDGMVPKFEVAAVRLNSDVIQWGTGAKGADVVFSTARSFATKR